jgi:hypothetical protein
MAIPSYDIPAACAKAVVGAAVAWIFAISDTATAQAHSQVAQTRVRRY